MGVEVETISPGDGKLIYPSVFVWFDAGAVVKISLKSV